MPGSCPRIKSEEGMTVEGVARGRALLVEDLVPILPFGVHGVDEPDLPGARPVLHRALALDRVADVLEALVPDEPPQPVCLREPLDGAGAVLPRAQREIGGHAEIERAVAPIAHQIHPAALRHGARTTTPLHAPPPSWPGSARPSAPSFNGRCQDADARLKAGHDDEGGTVGGISVLIRSIVMARLAPAIHVLHQ